MTKRRIGLKELIRSLWHADSYVRFSAGRPSISFEQLEDRLLLTTVPVQAAITGFADNWWISNVGQVVDGQAGTPGADISLENAWDITTGSKGVIVADLEDGVSYNNNELSPSLFENAKEDTALLAPVGDNDLDGFDNDAHGWNFADETNNPSNAPYDGTGTAVAGLIGAAGDAADPIIGVDWNVTIMPFKILMDQNAVTGAMTYDTASLIAGLNYIAMRKNEFGDNIAVVVMNLYQLDAAIKYNDVPLINALQRVTNAGIVIVSGAGDTATGGVNDDVAQTVLTEANDSRIIQVAATDNQDNLWLDSNYGPNTVQLAAPGVDIPAMGVGAATGALGITDESGTALSAALVAGVLALEKSAAPGASADQLISALLKGTDPLLGLTGVVKSGGRLDALKAVENIIGDVAPIGGTTLYTNSMITGYAEDFDSIPNPIQVQLVVNGNVVATQTADGPSNGGYGFTFTNVAALQQPGSLQTSIVAIDPLSGKGTTIKSEVLNIQNEIFVTHLYQDALDRQPDPGGLYYWATQVAAGTPTIQIAEAFTHSAEYATNFVDGLYQNLLNEAPDPVNAPLYISQLENGATLESIENSFLSSAQYFTLTGGTDQAWIGQLYQTLLGRVGSTSDINSWVNFLVTHTQQQLVNGFLYSHEYRTDQENAYYQQYLHRTGSSGEVASWVNTSLDQLSLQEAIFGSHEYFWRSSNSQLYVATALTPASQTLTAGTASAPITVTLIGRFGNAVNANAGGQVIDLSTTSADGQFTDVHNVPVTTVTVAAGASTATFLYKDTLAGTPTITATAAGDPSVISAIQRETVTGAAPAKLTFLTAPQTMSTDTASGPITFELKDTYGNVTTAPEGGLVVTLTSTSGAGSFTNTNNNVVTTITVPAGASTASFNYLDTTAGTPTLTISAAGLTSSTQMETVKFAVPTQIAFSTAPQNIATGAPSHLITVQLLDALGHATVAGTGGAVISLSSTSAGGSFVNLSNAPITTVTLAAGIGTASFKYVDTLAGTPTIRAASTGLTLATQGETVTAPVATALAVITATQTLTAGVNSGTITVQLQDQSAQPFNAPAGGITVNLTTTSAQGTFKSLANATITTLTIAAGTNTASFEYVDTTAGTPTITMARAGLSSGTQQETVHPAAAAALAFATAPQNNIIIGTASATMAIELKDQYGNLTTATSPVVVNLASSSAGGSFQSTTGSTITSVTILGGGSTASFKYIDTLLGTPTLTASTMFGATPATAIQTETVNPVPATRLTFTTSPQTLTAGVTSGTITVELLDANSHVTTAPSGGITINLATTSLGGEFLNGVTQITGVTVAQGAGTASFTYNDTVAATPTIAASSTGLTSATQIETVNPAAATQLAFTTATQSLNPNIPSANMTVTLEDQYGNAVNAGADITVNLSTTSSDGSFTNTGGTAVTSVTMTSGTNSVSFKYVDSAVGTPTVTAAATGLISGTQQESVVPLAATQIVFLGENTVTQSIDGTLPHGTLSPALTVELEDVNGNPAVAPAGGLVINLTSNSGSGVFYNGNGNVITSVTVAAGTSIASFRYSDTFLQVITLTASKTGLTSAVGKVTISADNTHQAVTFVSTAQTLTSGVASTTITVQLSDINGFGDSDVGVTLNLTSNFSTGIFYSGATPITTVTTDANGMATFTYVDTAPTGAMPIIMVRSGSVLIVPGTQQETMN